MRTFKIGKATVHIHGNIDKDRLDKATIIFLKKVIRQRRRKEERDEN